jgi:hypothetical protein
VDTSANVAAPREIDETPPERPATSARRPVPAWRSRALGAAPVAAVAGLAGLVFVVIHKSLIDDAYITLDYARTLAWHGEWGMLPGAPNNTATTPLYVLLLAAGTRVFGSPVVAVGAVFVASFAVLAHALRRAATSARLPAWSGTLGALLVLVNPLMLSSVGMGVDLFAALLAVLLQAAVQHRAVLFGLAAGLLALARLDLVLFVPLLLVGRPGLWRGWWKIGLSAAAVSLPWFVWSWYALGSAIPDTLVIKQVLRGWGIWEFDRGLELFLGKYPMPTALSLLAPVLGTLALAAWLVLRVVRFRRPGPRRLDAPALLALGGIGYYVAYTQLGVAPYHWYYAPTVTALTILLAMAAGAAVAGAGGLAARVAAGAGAAVPALLVAAQLGFTGWQGLPWSQAPIMSNGFTPADYARMGLALRERVGDATVASPDEIGTLAYFCGCNIMDGFSDRGYLPAQLAQREAESGPFGRALLELNYRHLDRDLRPRPLVWQLRRVDGPGPDPVFTGSSAWATVNHLDLVPAEH